MSNRYRFTWKHSTKSELVLGEDLLTVQVHLESWERTDANDGEDPMSPPPGGQRNRNERARSPDGERQQQYGDDSARGEEMGDVEDGEIDVASERSVHLTERRLPPGMRPVVGKAHVAGATTRLPTEGLGATVEKPSLMARCSWNEAWQTSVKKDINWCIKMVMGREGRCRRLSTLVFDDVNGDSRYMNERERERKFPRQSYFWEGGIIEDISKVMIQDYNGSPTRNKSAEEGVIEMQSGESLGWPNWIRFNDETISYFSGLIGLISWTGGFSFVLWKTIDQLSWQDLVIKNSSATVVKQPWLVFEIGIGKSPGAGFSENIDTEGIGLEMDSSMSFEILGADGCWGRTSMEVNFVSSGQVVSTVKRVISLRQNTGERESVMVKAITRKRKTLLREGGGYRGDDQRFKYNKEENSAKEQDVDSVSLSFLRSFCGSFIDKRHFIEADGAAGGLVTCWSSRVFTCSEVLVRKFSLTLHLSHIKSGECFYVTNAYGPSTCEGKDDFCSELAAVQVIGWCAEILTSLATRRKEKEKDGAQKQQRCSMTSSVSLHS
ncbi:hypothetical protein ACMD2_05095 [Ananas comosus]|uniref:Uncharacterized protein n=1 Tax=Ananas comosus TaxID=4615 RepID=A0A199UKX6_ANACO|nr:hypothetical protein ACMD2_05095 [Ananas comosus]